MNILKAIGFSLLLVTQTSNARAQLSDEANILIHYRTAYAICEQLRETIFNLEFQNTALKVNSVQCEEKRVGYKEVPKQIYRIIKELPGKWLREIRDSDDYLGDLPPVFQHYYHFTASVSIPAKSVGVTQISNPIDVHNCKFSKSIIEGYRNEGADLPYYGGFFSEKNSALKVSLRAECLSDSKMTIHLDAQARE